jgi:hypothetical protein
MKTALHAGKLITLLLVCIFSFSSARAGTETIPSGSFIVNMGVLPQTYANGLKPWGMVYDLIQNYKVQVKWIINPAKVKDGVDFSYNGVDYRGGTFVIIKKYRTAAVDSRIAYWQTQGVVGVTTTSDVDLNVTYTLKYTPRWTFDFQNGKIALAYLTAAGIPNTNYPMKDPDQLNSCDDLFVMPHADPTWATHNNLLAWNKNTRGWLWYGCHAGSVIEDSYNPLDPTQQMNFLTQTGLVLYSDHSNPTPPYNYRYPTDPEMQFMGKVDDAVTNGSEQVYLPKLGGGWRPGAKVAVWDPTMSDVPSKSPGEAAILAYGRAFDNPAYGKVMFQAGHNFDKGNADAVAAIRAFFNFSFMSVADKEIVPAIMGPTTASSTGTYTYAVSLPAGYDPSKYAYHWTASCNGKFSNEFGSTTTFTPKGITSCDPCRIMVTVTDQCGREYYQDIYLNDLCSTLIPPVALDRTASVLNNAQGTGAQPVIGQTPLAGTDADGYVVNYILKSLPAGGQFFYDNDSDSKTADVVISSLPAGGLVLSATQMKSLKFDPVDGFAGMASFQYTVTDNNGLVDATPATYQIPVNTPPDTKTFVCSPVYSNAQLTAACPLQATDNGKIVSYTIVTLPSASQCLVYLYGVLVSAGDVLSPYDATQLKYLPAGNYIGYAEITYTATDDMGATDPTPATLTLQMVNTPPTANDGQADAIGNPVGTSKIGLKALTATDPDGTIASYTLLTIPTPDMGVLYYNSAGSTYLPATPNLVLTPAQAGSLKFDPADTYSGVATFKFTATDDGGLKDLSAATYSIPVMKTPPVTSDVTSATIYAGASSFLGNECSVAGLVAKASSNKSIVSYSIITLPPAGNGKLYYKTNGNSYDLVSENQELSISQASTLKFVPVPGVTGKFLFRYTAKDNEGLVDPTPSNVFMTVVNAAPDATDVSFGPLADTAGMTKIPAPMPTDADGSIASITILTLPDPAAGVLFLRGQPVTKNQLIPVADTAYLQFDPVLHNSRKPVFLYTATDNFGLIDPKAAQYTINITVIPYKKAPKADSKDNPVFNLLQVNHQLVPVSGSDSDGVVTRFVVTKIPAANQGALNLQGVPVVAGQQIGLMAADQFTFVPSGTFKGSTSFSYQSMDNDSLLSPEATVKITLNNALPVATDIRPADVKKGANTYMPPLAAIDSDGTVTSFKIVKLPTRGTMKYDSTGTGVFGLVKLNMKMTPAQVATLRFWSSNTLGLDTLQFAPVDNMNDVGNTANYIINIASTAANQLPVVSNISTTLSMKAALSPIPALQAKDLDGTIAWYTIESVPPSFYGVLYYNNGTTDVPIYQAALKLTPTQAATLKFIPSGIYQGDVAFSVNAIDDDGDMSATPATYTITLVNPLPTAVSFTNPTIPSTAGPTFLNTLTGTDDSTLQNFIINLLPDPSQGILVLDGTPVSLNQVIPAELISHLEFDPADDFSGTATFKFTVMDNLGAISAAPAVVTIPVTNAIPVADAKISQVITNQIGTGPQAIPAFTATDNDGSIASYVLLSLPAGGKLYKNGTLISTITNGGVSISPNDVSKLTFDPNDNFGGTASFTYAAKDNSGNMSAPVSYQILVNLPPVANNGLNAAMYPKQTKTALNALAATDDGSVALFSLTKLPPTTDGTLYFNNVAVTNLAQVDSIQPSQVGLLSFQPSTTFGGTALFFTATDNMGVTDVTPAVINIPYTIAPPMVLPVNLLKFTGATEGANDRLQWSTANEMSMSRYEVEYSTDGRQFQKLGSVGAKGAVTAAYQYLNRNVKTAVTYYRLKMLNADQSFTYSPIVMLKRASTSVVVGNVMPNPFSSKVGVVLDAEKPDTVTVTLTSFSGQVVKSVQTNLAKGHNEIWLTDLQNLSDGSYILTIASGDLQEKKVVIKVK